MLLLDTDLAENSPADRTLTHQLYGGDDHHRQGVTGWAFGDATPTELDDRLRFQNDANSLFEKLEQVVVPQYYRNRDDWLRIMSHPIALNASHFNTHRMVQQYVLKAYYK